MSKAESAHLNEESQRLITCLNNYSVQIAPEHSAHDENDGITWISWWPAREEGIGIDELLRHIGFVKETQK